MARTLLNVRAMLRIRTLAFVTLAILGAAGCGKKAAKDQQDKQTNTPPSAPSPAPLVAAAPTPPPPPPAPTYSPDAAKQLVATFGDCVIADTCDAYKTLVGFGAQVGPDLLTALADPALPADSKKLVVDALGALKLPDVGPKLVELGSDPAYADLQDELFKAAGASGGQAAFDALIGAYDKAIRDSDDDRDIPLRGGLRAFPAESVAWAKDQLAKRKPKDASDATGIADLITDSATTADLPAVVEALGKSKDVMVRDRLAAKAIELGDLTHFDVFVAGLKSKDQYDRSDAAGFLADVADKAPADLKPTLIELLEKGKAGDQGGLTAMGYDEALKKLQ